MCWSGEVWGWCGGVYIQPSRTGAMMRPHCPTRGLGLWFSVASSGPVHTAGWTEPGKGHVISGSGDAVPCGLEDGSTGDLVEH